jgi:hypothetical protein
MTARDPLALASALDVKRMFKEDPDAPDFFSGVSLPTVAASSPIMRKLYRDLAASASALPAGSELRRAIDSVVRGEQPLSSLLSNPGFPAPGAKSVGRSTAEMIELIQEDEAK